MEKILTFLFTDIEGSTRLWEQQPQIMSALLVEHNHILNQAIASNHGKVFKTVGDGFCAVFDSASDALAAALYSQRGLQTLKNDYSTTLKVRMGLHSGAAEERDGDYFGPTLNRVARIMAAASGGQILISATVKLHLENPLSQEVELRDLGTHRLRDIKELTQIFQVDASDLRHSFSPIKSLSPRPTNLPAQLTSFVGRDHDVDNICRLLRQPQTRLLTLIGPGGIGKTRLSIQAGTNLQDEYTNGVFFVALAPVSHLEGVIETVAQALKVDEPADVLLIDALKAHLRDCHLLLVLDNFEQVVDAAPVLNELLTAAPRLKIIVSSREELMIYGEYVYMVAPLALPEDSLNLDLSALMKFSAVKLFVERVRSVQTDFMLDIHTAPHVIEICRRLDGLPLAIELAAVRIRDLSVQSIAEQLSNRLQVLSKGPRDFPSRQRTMRGAIEWSFNLLPLEEQQAFVGLSVFVGSFTAEAADAVTGVGSLNRLKEKSLIHQNYDDGQIVSFVMFETLREYAWEQLVATSQATALQRQHANYYVHLTEIAEPNLTGSHQVDWFNRLELENHNVQAALEWLLSQDDIASAGSMASVLWRYWGAHSRMGAGSQWIEQIMKHSQALSTPVRAKLTQGMGRMLYLQYRYLEAAKYLKTSLALYDQTNDPLGQANIYLSLGEVELRQNNSLAAEGYFQSGLALFIGLDDQAGFARCLAQLGRLAVRGKNLVSAESLFQQSLELIRKFGSTESIAIIINDLAEVLREQAKYAEAEALYQESLMLYRQLDFGIGMAVILHNLGQVSRQLGDNPKAFNYFQEALHLLQNMEEKQIIVECLAGLGGVFLGLGQSARAIRFLSASDVLMETIPLQLDITDQVDYEHSLATARQLVDPAMWEKSWAEGRTLLLEQIFAEIL